MLAPHNSIVAASPLTHALPSPPCSCAGSVKLHITPLRASRALALRFMAHKHRMRLASLALVCCAASVDKGGATARFVASDAEDLVAGVQVGLTGLDWAWPGLTGLDRVLTGWHQALRQRDES